VVAVDDVDLTVRPGEIVAFLGPNGAGKTTTVDMLLGLTAPDAGTIEVYGSSPGDAVRLGQVSAVMQTGGLLGDFTVGETVRAIAALHGRSDRVEIVLERAHLTDLAARRVEACSGGEQQRLKFALALLPDPDLVVLDEPTTGMDVAARQEFWRAMREDAAQGRTIVFATHYLAEADEFAERTVLMNHGRIVHDAATADVRAAYGGRTLTFRPPAGVVGTDGVDVDWLARVRHALEPLGVTDVDVSAASLEAAFLALTAETPVDTVLEGATR
jgi:ABC-2 type transport system ATP-binding protein